MRPSPQSRDLGFFPRESKRRDKNPDPSTPLLPRLRDRDDHSSAKLKDVNRARPVLVSRSRRHLLRPLPAASVEHASRQRSGMSSLIDDNGSIHDDVGDSHRIL